MSSAIDFVENDILTSNQLNSIKNNFAGPTQPSNPVTGCRWMNTPSYKLKIYDAGVFGLVGISANPFPPGAVMAWCPGYFTNGSNAGYTFILGSANTITGANAYLNLIGWYVCDGAAVNHALSIIWNAASRYLPNLTDDRFIMGDTIVAVLGGSNTMEHTHPCDPASKTSTTATGVQDTQDSSPGGSYYVDDSHTHDCDLPSFNSAVTKDGASGLSSENRPSYLALFYIVRVW